ncbi:17927_t:CDS:1 [Dentiscutata erythropus]|uniref:17927_t:CDS:1 n=1 Tax=Dentiscutata erythropus TaxID=1348616 RepID=A0A9N9N9C6_9GLOM|nr:17927_t:CDS:1 [Dentiscutata erythropus]
MKEQHLVVEDMSRSTKKSRINNNIVDMSLNLDELNSQTAMEALETSQSRVSSSTPLESSTMPKMETTTNMEKKVRTKEENSYKKQTLQNLINQPLQRCSSLDRAIMEPNDIILES